MSPTGLYYLPVLALSTALGCAPLQTASTRAAPSNRAHPLLAKARATPDYLQTDPAFGGLPGGGAMYCAPVSVSNSLIWLDDNGFDQLAPNSSDRKRDQYQVIRLLGAKGYMNTSLSSGTDVVGVLRGIHRYIRRSGHSYRSLKYQGWRPHPAEFSTDIDIPEPSWIHSGIQGTGSAWVNVGWYTYNVATDVYRRIGGHWLTVAGSGHDGNQPDRNYLVLHDPSPGAGRAQSHEFVRLEEITSGMMQGNYSGLPRRAAGYYRLTDNMHLGSNADVAILDGVVVLRM